MSLSERLARLTPEQRALLELRLKTRQQAVSVQQPTIGKRSNSTPASLSFGQERLWFLEQLEEPSAIYNICSARRLRGVIDPVSMDRALAEIVRRHESLRTIFPPSTGNNPPFQQIAGTANFRLETLDLSTDPEKENAIRHTVATIAREVMPLAKGPLFRVHLLRVTNEDHVLVVVMHHIISDGWSLDVFLRELSTLYADFHAGRNPSLTPLDIQYADFAQWQRHELQGSELQRHVSYWKKQLADAAPVLNLPTDFPRPNEQSYRGAYCGRQIGTGLTEKINQLCQKTETTPFMTLLAAFKILLHRYSGQTDILVGSPVSNRARIELEPLIGFFVNMLVLRTTFTGESTASEVIRQVRQSTLDALAHQSLSFEKLVQELQPVRDLSYTPFFQAALMFQQEEANSFQLPGVKIESIPTTTATAKFDLTLYANENAHGLSLLLEYATDLFTAATAERLLAHLECLLESIVAQPEAKVGELNLLRPEDRRQITLDWNQTAVDYPRDKTVHQLFFEQAARTPNAIAVEFGRQRLGYRDLALRVDALAGILQRAGVTIETHVGIYVERSIDMVVGVLGILQAGGTYVPLDPAFPKDRLAFMVEDAKIPVIITQKRLLKELPANHAQIVFVDDQTTGVSPSSTVAATNGPENLAYILFTSGSTGRPKGVQIPHRAVVNFLNAMRRAPGLTAHDALLAVTTLSFDIAGLELFLPLTTGARIVIASREEAIDGARLAQMMKASGITVMQATPATWRMLLEAGWEGDPQLKILCGGEAIDRALADSLLTRCGELWNMYGPTETTIWSTTERLLPGQSITIGRPIDNTQTYILDEKSAPVPPGVSGELYIGGDGVARGYLNRPELTAEKFVPDHFASDKQRRLYRTGDLARYCTDGRIEFLGRSDFQVKIRGFRIEIGEIETALNAIEGVAQAVVKVHDDALGGKRLVGYIVPKMPAAAAASPGVKAFFPAFDVAALRNQLRLHLPDYMIPPAFVFLEALPLTPNGKVDRKALPEPDKTASQEAQYEAPVGATEEKLAGIMATLLRLPKVGRSDDFFALGGYSILAVSFFNEVERVLGKRIPLATLFRAPTVASLAVEIEKENVTIKRWNSLVPIQANGSKSRFFCVHGAGGNILLYRDLAHHLGPDYPFYGLQSQGLDKQTQPLTTVEEMAEKYLEEIRELQPHGPYCLGGYCLGGTIAYEMAQRLHREGHEVALLALFDTYNFTRMDQAKALPFFWQKLTFHARNLAGLSWRELSGYITNKVRVATDGELRSLWKSFSKSPQRKQNALEINIQETNDAAAAAYRPKAYSGKVTVFKPKVNYDFFPDPKMGWGENVQGELDIVALPINPHAMLVAPFVKHLVEELRGRIDRIADGNHAESKQAMAQR